MIVRGANGAWIYREGAQHFRSAEVPPLAGTAMAFPNSNQSARAGCNRPLGWRWKYSAKCTAVVTSRLTELVHVDGVGRIEIHTYLQPSRQLRDSGVVSAEQVQLLGRTGHAPSPSVQGRRQVSWRARCSK
jgi:hypothetical protein